MFYADVYLCVIVGKFICIHTWWHARLMYLYVHIYIYLYIYIYK